MNGERRDWLDRRVRELIRIETEIEQAVHDTEELPPQPEVTSKLLSFAALSVGHREGLLAYLGTRSEGVLTSARFSGETDVGWATALPRLYATFCHAAISYAGLFEAALRLYDQDLRDLAPRYQDDYAGVTFELADLLAPTIAAELLGRGLECHCDCPMCSLGVCGCVAMGRAAATELLRPQDGVADGGGFVIHSPRSGSQLAEAGVLAGDRLVAVDDQQVTTVREVQTAIRRRRIGDSLHLLVARGQDERHVDVTHVRDYPS